MRLILALCCVAALQLGSHAFATSVPEAASVDNMAGAWRAVGRTGDHYRVVLDGRARGQLGIAIYGSELTFEIESVEYDGNKVIVRLAHNKGKLTGEAYPGQFLQLSGGKVWGDESRRFFPEHDWRDKEDRLGKIMREAAK
jgi:hypothetical protein